MDTPNMANGAMDTDEAAPLAGGALAAPVGLDVDEWRPEVALAPSEAVLENGDAVEKAVLLPALAVECMLRLSLERPLVDVANKMLVEPDRALEVVLLITELLVEDVSSKIA